LHRLGTGWATGADHSPNPAAKSLIIFRVDSRRRLCQSSDTVENISQCLWSSDEHPKPHLAEPASGPYQPGVLKQGRRGFARRAHGHALIRRAGSWFLGSTPPPSTSALRNKGSGDPGKWFGDVFRFFSILYRAQAPTYRQSPELIAALRRLYLCRVRMTLISSGSVRATPPHRPRRCHTGAGRR
jgi:hypothetical protein